MNTALDILVTAILFFVVIWLVIFGVAGVLLATRARVGRPIGFILGAVFGPFGITWLAWHGHRVRSRDVTSPSLVNSTHLRRADKESSEPLPGI